MTAPTTATRLKRLYALQQRVMREIMRVRQSMRVLDEQGRTRVKIVRAEGTKQMGFDALDPDVAKPHIDEFGWCDENADCPEMGGRNPKITLDSGFVIWGYQCWWTPVDAEGRAI